MALTTDRDRRLAGAYRLSVWLGPALLAALLNAGCVNPHATQTEMTPDPEVIQIAGKFHKEYVMVPGDQIEVSVWRVPEASRTVTIRADGFISLPLVGQVKAARLTIPELQDSLTKLLSTRLVNPDVTVIAVQTRQPTVYVLGDVRNPSAVPLRDAATPVQAIARAGGLQRSGAAADVSIIRLTKDGHVVALPVNAPDRSQPGPYLALGLTVLQADDIVFVPESGRSEVARFVDDFVLKPLLLANLLADTYFTYKYVAD